MERYMLTQSMGLVRSAISASHEALSVQGTGLIRLVNPPSTPTSQGVSGYNVAFSGDYFYACTGENQWGRAQVSRFFQLIYCNDSEYYTNNAVIYCNASGY